MAEFLTSHVVENEIVKANDFEFAFENLVTNVSKATQMFLESRQDFVINGKVLANTTPDMFVRISPIFGVCKSTGVPFGNTELENLSIGFAETSYGRVAVIEVKGEWEEYDEQQRAFNDPDTDTQTYQYVNTKKRLKPVYQIIYGDEGSSVAPEVDSGWVKLAEVVIRANATQILDSDIKNITSDIAGEDNEGWTTQADITYNIGYISDVNERFRVQHNEDGTHKDNVINSDSLNIGTGSKQINSTILPVGASGTWPVSIPTQTIAATDSIVSVLSKITTMLTSLYNAYLKFGNYNFNGELAISSIADANNALTKPLKLVAAGDGTAVLKIGDDAVLSIDANGRLSTNGYTANANNNLITKAITDALSTTITNNYNDLSGQISTLRETLNGVKEFANDILSRYTLSDIAIAAVSTANVTTLRGEQTIDGQSVSAEQYVLLKDQTDKTQNGVWEVQTGNWDKVAASSYKDKLFIATAGTVNGGKIFYSPELFEQVDSNTEIIFKEANFSIKKIANKIVMRDSNGKAYLDIVGNVTGNVTGNVSGSSGSCTGNAATATSAGKLTTARKVYVRLGTASTTETKDFSGDTAIPVDGTLAVGNGGTGQTTLSNVAVGSASKLTTARKVYVKLGTASTTETKDFSGDTAIPVDGTLNVANGGTGKATHTANAVLTGNGTNAVKNVATASGAFYATAANGAPQFGTLPVAQGGTGATSSSDARLKLGIGYGTCATAAGTAAKTATITGFKCEEGSRLAIKFSNANTAANPTLNITTASGVTTGAKDIYLRGTTKRPAGGNYYTWNAGETVEFVYTGSAFEMQKAINIRLVGTTLYVEY